MMTNVEGFSALLTEMGGTPEAGDTNADLIKKIINKVKPTEFQPGDVTVGKAFSRAFPKATEPEGGEGGGKIDIPQPPA